MELSERSFAGSYRQDEETWQSNDNVSTSLRSISYERSGHRETQESVYKVKCKAGKKRFGNIRRSADRTFDVLKIAQRKVKTNLIRNDEGVWQSESIRNNEGVWQSESIRNDEGVWQNIRNDEGLWQSEMKIRIQLGKIIMRNI